MNAKSKAAFLPICGICGFNKITIPVGDAKYRMCTVCDGKPIPRELRKEEA